jgi:hypothetical protein
VLLVVLLSGFSLDIGLTIALAINLVLGNQPFMLRPYTFQMHRISGN